MQNIDQVLKSLQSEINNIDEQLEKQEQQSRLIRAMEIYKGKYEVIPFDEIESDKAEQFQPNPTGMPELDESLKGFRSGDIVTLAGLTGSGKTQYGMQLSSAMAKYNPLWLSYEMPPQQLRYQFKERALTLPVLFTPQQNKHNDLAWVEERIIESIVKYGTEIVFIDNLDFIIPDESHPEHRNIKKAVYALKDIANKWQVTILLMAHMNRDGGDETKIPTRDQLKGSSAIEQISSTILIIWREAYKKNKQLEKTSNALVKIAKNRWYGKEPNIKYTFNDKTYEYERNEWADYKGEDTKKEW